MFMQQGGPMGPRGGGAGGFSQGQNVLQGPLAYLEKASNIGRCCGPLDPSSR